MIRLVRLLAVIALSALVMGGVYMAWWALATPGGFFAALPTTTPQGTSLTPKPRLPDLLEVRLHYCDGRNTYSLLSLPRDATFRMGVALASASTPVVSTNTAQIPITGFSAETPSQIATPTPVSGRPARAAACEDVGTADSRKFVLCRAPGPARLTITVDTSTGSGEFVLSLAACKDGNAVATPAKPESATQVPSSSPVRVPTSTP